MSNLRQIGQAIYLYAAASKGAMPPDFAALVVAEGLTQEIFVCPSSNDERTKATQPAELRAAFQLGAGHCSYVYLGSGSVQRWTTNDVISFDANPNHDSSINALFGDGHVESVEGAMVSQLLQRPSSATQPIRLPPNRSPELRGPR